MFQQEKQKRCSEHFIYKFKDLDFVFLAFIDRRNNWGKKLDCDT